jgi:F-type H+-transporting ATPase subunit gamma
MATLRDIKRRISAVASTAKITQAMKMVSSAKLKRAQDAILNARPYSNLLKSNLYYLIDSIGDNYSHPLLEKREKVNNILLMLITSDRGLCGSFNSNLIRFTTKYIQSDIFRDYPQSNLKAIRIGKRGIAGFKGDGIEFLKNVSGISGRIDFGIIEEVAKLVINGYLSKDFDRVLIFFNEFKNVLTQVPKVIELLPFDTGSEKTVKDSKFRVNYIFEPDPKSILDSLIPKYVENQILRIMLESNAAEHAARRLAMENATNNAHDLIQQLELIFNKERQASITKEMLEIVGGANALKGR